MTCREWARWSNKDFEETSGTLTFEPGQRSKNFQVPIINDRIDEPTEDFYPSLSNEQNATLGLFSAMGEIVDDDPLPTVRVNPSSAPEGELLWFEVYLSHPSSEDILVYFETVAGPEDGGAQPSDEWEQRDYVHTFGSITFQGTDDDPFPDDEELLRAYVPVETEDDEIEEEDKYFYLQVSTGAAHVGGTPPGRAPGWIIDNDGPAEVNIGERTWGSPPPSPRP